MSSRELYAPGAASGAEVRKDGETWTPVGPLAHRPEHAPLQTRFPAHRPADPRPWGTDVQVSVPYTGRSLGRLAFAHGMFSATIKRHCATSRT